MTFSPARMIVLCMIGLPIGFILSALAFVTMGYSIEAPALAPWAGGVALLIGLGAAVWRPAE